MSQKSPGRPEGKANDEEKASDSPGPSEAEAEQDPQRWFADQHHDYNREWVEATGNPTFVWEGIGSVCYDAWVRASKTWDDHSTLPRIESVPFPDWIFQYLQQVSWRIKELCYGRDWRNYPKMTADEAADREARQRYRDHFTLTPTEAADLLPLALGFTRPGWNAFSEWARIRESQAAAEDINTLTYGSPRQPPLRKSEAKAQVMRDYDFEDERSFRRFLSQAHPKLRKKGAKPDR